MSDFDELERILARIPAAQRMRLSRMSDAELATWLRERLKVASAAESPFSERSPAQRPMAGRKTAEPDEFLEFKSVYPTRAGSQRWRDALNACKARLREGCSWAEILAGARRYAAFIEATDKAGTEYVLQARTFVGPEKHFRDPWAPPRRQRTAIERLLHPERDDERLVN